MLGFFTAANSQTLQFNDVINLVGTGSGVVDVDTVPAGKTWKLEKIISQATHIMIYDPATSVELYITQNNNNYASIGPGTTAGATTVSPTWIKEGMIIRRNGSVASSKFFVSVLEFDIVP